MAFRSVLRLQELWDGDMRVAIVDGKRVVLVRVGATVTAFEDRCAHLGVPLSSGKLERGVITCSAHHWQYDAATGNSVNPRGATVRRYPVRVVEGQVEVDVEGTA